LSLQNIENLLNSLAESYASHLRAFLVRWKATVKKTQ